MPPHCLLDPAFSSRTWHLLHQLLDGGSGGPTKEVREGEERRGEERGEESPPRRHRHTGRGKGRDFVMYREPSLHPTEALGRPKRNTSAQTDCRYRAAYTHIRPVVGWESVGVAGGVGQRERSRVAETSAKLNRRFRKAEI